MKRGDLIYKYSFVEDTERLLDLISKGSFSISNKQVKIQAKDWVKNYYDLLEILDPQGRGYKAFISLSNSITHIRLKKREWTQCLRTILKEYHSLSLKNGRNGKKALVGTGSFIATQRLKELKTIKSVNYDLTRLIRMCEELDDNFSNENYITSIALVRAILDHVPPIFGCRNFLEIANHCEKSIKESLQHLQDSSRKIADSYLHIQIRKKEILPTATQVNFSTSLDVLLGEVVRRLK